MIKEATLVGGMGRLGSTVIYNIVRYILVEKYPELTSGFYYDNKVFYDVMKAHAFNSDLVLKYKNIILPVRNLKDVIISHDRYLPNKYSTIKDLKEQAEFLISLYNKWKPFASYIFNFDEYKEHPEKTIIQVSETYGIEIDPSLIRSKIEDLSKDPKSLCGADHITSDKECPVSQEEISVLVSEINNWPTKKYKL